MELTKEQLLQIKILDVESKLARAKVSEAKLALQLLAKDGEILKLKMETQRMLVQEQEGVSEAKLEERRKYMKQLATSLNVPEGSAWGFDPVSGTITLE